VQLDSVSKDLLTWSLEAPAFMAELRGACKLPLGTALRFTNLLFQPVPWSPETKHGMPKEMEVRCTAGLLRMLCMLCMLLIMGKLHAQTMPFPASPPSAVVNTQTPHTRCTATRRAT